MKDEEAIETNSLTSPVGTTPPPRASSPYELLLRQNKKLGGFATKAFHDLKTILNHEITLPSKDRLLNSITFAPRQKEGTVERNTDEIEELKRVVHKSHEVLAAARTVFLMKLFPDKVVVDRTKITITRRDFFWSSNVVSIRIEDVLNVGCGVGPLFGSITISSRVMNSVDHFEINFLWRNEAMYLKDIIQGYMIAKHNKIDTSQLAKDEMIETLTELGHDSSAQ